MNQETGKKTATTEEKPSTKRTEAGARAFIESLKPLQDAGLRFPCPRCGYDRMHTEKPVRNALSRYATVYVCEVCGMDEAMRDMVGEKLPLTEWSMALSFKEDGK